MDQDTTVNADNKEQLQVEETDDACRVDYIEIVPAARGADGSCTTECVSGDLLGEVREEELSYLKQEPSDVCCVLFFSYVCFYHSRKNLFRSSVQGHGFRSTSVIF